jgi:hypothetical protein
MTWASLIAEKSFDMMLDIFYIMSDFLVIPIAAGGARNNRLRKGAPMSRTLAILAAAILAGATPAFAQHAAAPTAAASTTSLQGDQASWINDAHMHAFYDLTVAAFAGGPAKVDEAAYRAKSYELFRAFGAAHGVKPEAMQDHLKLIPGQMVKIAREDPEVLKTYANFVAAMFGPQ